MEKRIGCTTTCPPRHLAKSEASRRIQHGVFAGRTQAAEPAANESAEVAEKSRSFLPNVTPESEDAQFAGQLAFGAAEPVDAIRKRERKKQGQQVFRSRGKAHAGEPAQKLRATDN